MPNVSLVATDLTKLVAYGPCRVLQIFGFNNQSTDRYVQFHQALTVAASDVPSVKALYCPAGTGFSWPFPHGLALSDLCIAVSTTETSYTAPSAGGGLDFTIVVESAYLATSATTVAGDLTTGVTNLAVWAEASGPKRLLRLDVLNSTGSTKYARIYAVDSDATGDTTAKVIGPLTDGVVKTAFFGAGYSPIRYDGGSTIRQACKVRGVQGADLDDAHHPVAQFSIRAVYE